MQVSPLTPFLSTQTIAISTHDDSEVEGTEEFEVILRIDPSRTIGNFVITRNVTTVIIRDNDIESKFSTDIFQYAKCDCKSIIYTGQSGCTYSCNCYVIGISCR